MKAQTGDFRKAYGDALIYLGKKYPDMVVLDADLSTSTKTAVFKDLYPDRFFNMGVAEQNMFAMAAGFAIDNRLVFASTFAVFAAGRAYDQIRQSIAYSSVNVKIVATHSGVTVGGDGASHEMVEDIGLMYGLPNMNIVVPCDANETYNAITAISSLKGPFYVRLPRTESILLTEKERAFAINELPIIRDGRDAAIIGAGQVLARAVKAADELEKEGITTAVYNMHTVKPVNRSAIVDIAKKYGAVVTVEEHSINTGIGSIVASVVSEEYPVHVEKVGIKDTFGESGEPEALLDKYGLSVKDIIAAVKNGIKHRR